jgi:hypothetical protein
MKEIHKLSLSLSLSLSDINNKITINKINNMTLHEFQQDTYDSCQRLLDNSGLSRVQFSDLLKESYEYTPDHKEFLEQFDPFQWYKKLFSFNAEKDILL